ncbi:MAG: prepilin-type N-terminal cleavage/methylation domain-containing protein [Armatimonadota bacterium]
MKRQNNLSGFTFVEFLVVIVVLAVLASLIFPIFAKSSHHSPAMYCNGRVRQLATAVQMYVHDNGSRFPSGANWEQALLKYVGSKKTYFCSADAYTNLDADPVSYGYNGLLVRLDGSGVNEAQVKSPVEVGVICDASPTKAWGAGGLVGGGALCDDAGVKKPEPRHDGVIIGYCDGHAKYSPGKKFDVKDTSSLVTRAFYMANALGLVDNPAGGLRAFSLPTATQKTSIVIGGDSCARPILAAAAEIWRKKTGAPFTEGFAGQFVAPKGGNYVWGCSDGTMPKGHAIAIARDALVVIVSRNTKIKHFRSGEALLGKDATPFKNQQYVVTTSHVSPYFDARVTAGFSADAWQAYTYNKNSGNRRYFERVIVNGVQPGKRAVTVQNDLEMIDKVAADPYGIGYCSSAFADFDRVQVLAIRQGEREYYFPNADIKHRYVLPVEPDWPYLRTLYAVVGDKAWGAPSSNTFGRLMLAPGGPGTKALQEGPLFQASYQLPRLR